MKIKKKRIEGSECRDYSFRILVLKTSKKKRWQLQRVRVNRVRVFFFVILVVLFPQECVSMFIGDRK